MIQDVIIIETAFELKNSPKNFRLTDNTPYASEGIALADVVGIFKIIGPDGLVAYENTDFANPDIDADVSLVFSGANLPLDANGLVQTGKYTVTYTIRVIGAVQAGDFPKVFTYTNSHVTPKGTLDLTVDCRCSKITSTDTTSYGPGNPVLVRVHTLIPPTGSELTNTVSSNPVITVTPITNKTWSASIVTTATYTFTDALVIIDEIKGSDENKVDCDISICDIFCCVKTLWDRYFAALDTNPFESQRILDEQLNRVMILVALHDKAVTCGLDALALTYHAEILKVSQCEPGCGCDDDKPTLIVPICGATAGAGSVVVDACGNGAITVTPVVVGDITTYTVCFDQTLLDRLNELFNTTLTAGAGITIVPTVAANGDIDYLVSSTALAPDESNLRLQIDFGIGVPVYTILNENIFGTKFKAATTAFKNSGNFALFSNQNNEFELKDFLTAADPFNQVLAIESIVFNNVQSILPVSAMVTSSVTAGNGSIKFQLLNSLGMPFSGAALSGSLDKIILTLKINSL